MRRPDNDAQAVLFILLQRNFLIQRAHLAIDIHTHIAGPPHIVQHPLVLALAASHQGCHDHEARAGGQLHDLVHNLLYTLLLDELAALRAVRLACASKEQAQIVVNLRHGTHRGAWVTTGGFLVDGNRGAEALDVIHLGLVHLAEKLARVRGKAFHVAALALGVNGVEGEAGLAAAAQARDDHQLIARDFHVNIF